MLLPVLLLLLLLVSMSCGVVAVAPSHAALAAAERFVASSNHTGFLSCPGGTVGVIIQCFLSMLKHIPHPCGDFAGNITSVGECACVKSMHLCEHNAGCTLASNKIPDPAFGDSCVKYCGSCVCDSLSPSCNK